MDRLVTLLPLLILNLIFFTDARDVKWCYPAGKKTDCNDISSEYGNIKCVESPDIYRCMKQVQAKTADIVSVNDKELYAAGKLGLKSILIKTNIDNETFKYKAVVVVKTDGKVKKLSDLKDAKSCHTGAGKTTGWTVPISNLIKMDILKPTKNCYSSTENVGDFFTESCVPGAMTERFNPFNLNPLRLCNLCKTNCSIIDEYAGYDGAKLCLKKTDADIAFVKQTTMLGEEDKTKYKLLCPDDKLMKLTEFNQCNWGARPNDVIMTAPQAQADLNKLAKDILDIVDNPKNDDLRFLKTDHDYSKVMGEMFKNSFEYYHNCKDQLRWCVVGSKELEKCNIIKMAFMAHRASNKLECVEVKHSYDCLKKIKGKEADFVVLDGGDIYTAINDYELHPIIAEDYGLGSASYYAVAVVKKDAKFNIKELKGKKSCHTGIGKTSGWKIPVSYLINNKFISKGGSIPVEVGKFFSASCVPGALTPEYDKDKKNPKSLCALCPKNGTDCQRNSENKYYDYSGAFRCLVETDADVAFVKHTTVLESTDGKGEEAWEKNLKSSNYQLLCKNGSLASVKDWQVCNLAKVPSHAIVTRKNNKDFDQLLFRVFSNFDLKSNETKDILFNSPGGKNLLFKDSTENLIYIEKPEKFLGKDYLDALKVFDPDENVGSGTCPASISIGLILFSLLTYFAKNLEYF